MAECDICTILAHKEEFNLIYEDELCFAILHENPSAIGHVMVIPVKHAAIIEELDDKSVERMFVVANKVSSAIFDTIGAHGTNILLNNGHDAGQELPHVIVHVFPRRENDSINFEWSPKQATPAQLKNTQSMIQTYSDYIFSGKESTARVAVKSDPDTQTDDVNIVKSVPGNDKEDKDDDSWSHDEEIKKKNKEDYLTRSLRRVP